MKFAKENSGVVQRAFWKLTTEAKFNADVTFEQISQMVKYNGDKSSASSLKPSCASLQPPIDLPETFRNTQLTAHKLMPTATKLDQQLTWSEDGIV